MQISIDLSLTNSVGKIDIKSLLYFAISSRRINPGANGDIMRIRRSGDNAEQSFAFVGETLDTTAIYDFIEGGGGTEEGYITEWYDQINSTNKMIQTTQAWQPLYKADAINNKIGMVSVTPVTNLGQLTNNNDLNYPTAATIFCVVDLVGDQGFSGAQPFSTDDVLLNNIFRVFLESTSYRLQGKDNLGNLFTTSLVSGNNLGKSLFVCTADGVDNIKVYRNGALAINYTETDGFLNILRNLTIGSFGGYLTEFLVFDYILNDYERNVMETDINNYYQLY